MMQTDSTAMIQKLLPLQVRGKNAVLRNIILSPTTKQIDNDRLMI